MAAIDDVTARVTALEVAAQAQPSNDTMVYCRDGLIAAVHGSIQGIDPVAAYGDGTTMMVRDPTWTFERVGDPPPEGQLDVRPFKCPY